MSQQPGLFERHEGDPLVVEHLDLPDATVDVYPGFFPVPDRHRLFDELLRTTAWEQAAMQIYGREVPIPRLQAWYGDAGASYSYSGIDMAPLPWTPALREVKDRIERGIGATFNSVLANLYRDGADSVGWHADDEPELGPAPLIASASFGATRTFQLRHQTKPGLRHTLELDHGSLVVMRGATQSHWKHQLTKTAQRVGPRVNLTFRTIV